MGVLARVLDGVSVGARSPIDDFWYTPIGSTMASAAGVRVTPETAQKTSAVFACVSLISETVASLPLLVYERLPDDARERATDHPLYTVLHERPNNLQTPFEFKEYMQRAMLLRGNAYAAIVPGLRSPVGELLPWHPDMVTVEKVRTGTVGMNGLEIIVPRYRFRQSDGTDVILNAEDVFHLRGLTLDGINGVSAIEYARESIGLAIAAESYGARIFSQDARPGGALMTEKTLSAEAALRLRTQWEAAHMGLSGAHKVAVLEEGMKWAQIGMTNEDAQFINTREFSVEDIARWFRVPVHMIGAMTKNTSWGTGIEALSIGFVTYTLRAWLVRWEEAATRDLLVETRQFFIEYLVDALLRGDLKTRFEAYGQGINGGWLNPDEIRQRENMNPIPDGLGQIYLRPANTVPAGTPAPQPQPPPGAAEPPPRRNEAHYRSWSEETHYQALLHDAAARVVRKEIAALSKAAKRLAGTDVEAWRQYVEEFYAEHVDMVMQALHITRQTAERYVNWQQRELLTAGVNVLESWETRRSWDLVALALEGQHAVAFTET